MSAIPSIPLPQLLDSWIPTKFDYKQENAPRFRWVLHKTRNDVCAKKRSDDLEKHESANFKKSLTRMMQLLEKAKVPAFEEIAKEQERLKELKTLVNRKYTRFKQEHSVPIISAIYKFFCARKLNITKEAFDRVITKKEEELKAVLVPPPVPQSFIPKEIIPTETSLEGIAEDPSGVNTSIISSAMDPNDYVDALASIEELDAEEKAQEKEKEALKKLIWAFQIGIKDPKNIENKKITQFYELFDAQTLPGFILRPYELVRALLSKPNPEKIIPKLATAAVRYIHKIDVHSTPSKHNQQHQKFEKILQEWLKARDAFESVRAKKGQVSEAYKIRYEKVNYSSYPWASNVLNLYKDLVTGLKYYRTLPILSQESLKSFKASTPLDHAKPWFHVGESLFENGINQELKWASEDKAYRELTLNTIQARKDKLTNSWITAGLKVAKFVPELIVKSGVKLFLPKFGSLIEYNKKKIGWQNDDLTQLSKLRAACTAYCDEKQKPYLEEHFTQRQQEIEAERRKLENENTLLDTPEGHVYDEAEKKVWDEILLPLTYAIIDHHQYAHLAKLISLYQSFLDDYEKYLQNIDKQPLDFIKNERQIELEKQFKDILKQQYICFEHFFRECLDHPMEKEFLNEIHNQMSKTTLYEEKTNNYTQLFWDNVTSRALLKIWGLPENYWQT